MTRLFAYGAAYWTVLALVAPLSTVPVWGTVWAAPSGQPDEGLRVYKSANCVGCHHWTGEGGGGYGGAAANLRQTSLTADQIKETIRCGRPTTGMPHFEADAYSDGRCYGLKKGDLEAAAMPPEPDHFLRPADVDAVTQYVITHLKGQGAPTFEQCQAFFGTGTRACDSFAKKPGGAATAAADSSGNGSAGDTPTQGARQSQGRVKIESAPDVNAGGK